VEPLLDHLTQSGEDFRLLLLSDHPTLLTTRTHDGTPVPYGIYDSRTVAKALREGKPAPMGKLSEKAVADAPLLEDGTGLMPKLFEE